jgi:leucyl/phenylalanyl-tRNA--protein transferase
MTVTVTPEILLRAYAMGVFPMAESQTDPTIHWVDPRKRGVFDLDQFHISRSLARRLVTSSYTVTINTDFAGVLNGCADRPLTWINPQITDLYLSLHRSGHAHSIEVWQENDLIGGVYGVSLGAGFFGESMFSRRTDASKVALAWLVHRLQAGGYRLFDTQFLTPHLATLGAKEISRAQYRSRLAEALTLTARFDPTDYHPTAQLILGR